MTELKKWEKHVVEEGSRQHVVWYNSQGAHCSCKNCEINKRMAKE